MYVFYPSRVTSSPYYPVLPRPAIARNSPTVDPPPSLGTGPGHSLLRPRPIFAGRRQRPLHPHATSNDAVDLGQSDPPEREIRPLVDENNEGSTRQRPIIIHLSSSPFASPPDTSRESLWSFGTLTRPATSYYPDPPDDVDGPDSPNASDITSQSALILAHRDRVRELVESRLQSFTESEMSSEIYPEFSRPARRIAVRVAGSDQPRPGVVESNNRSGSAENVRSTSNLTALPQTGVPNSAVQTTAEQVPPSGDRASDELSTVLPEQECDTEFA